MIKKEKRYIFRAEGYHDGHLVEPLYVFYNIRLRRFIIGRVDKKELYADPDTLRVVVSKNPDDAKKLELWIKKRIKNRTDFKYDIKRIFPVKCDSSKCDYLVSTLQYDDVGGDAGKFLGAKFCVRT